MLEGGSPGWADFTIMKECMPESGHCHIALRVLYGSSYECGAGGPHQAGLILPL